MAPNLPFLNNIQVLVAKSLAKIMNDKNAIFYSDVSVNYL